MCEEILFFNYEYFPKAICTKKTTQKRPKTEIVFLAPFPSIHENEAALKLCLSGSSAWFQAAVIPFSSLFSPIQPSSLVALALHQGRQLPEGAALAESWHAVLIVLCGFAAEPVT